MAEFGACPPLDLLPQLNPMTRALIHYSALQPAWRLTRADRVRAGLRRGLAAIFADCDVLAWPTSPGPAPAIDSPVSRSHLCPQPVDRANVRQTVLANVTGVPALSVPVALHQTGLPIGLQLLAPWGEEALLLNVAQRIEGARSVARGDRARNEERSHARSEQPGGPPAVSSTLSDLGFLCRAAGGTRTRVFSLEPRWRFACHGCLR